MKPKFKLVRPLSHVSRRGKDQSGRAKNSGHPEACAQIIETADALHEVIGFKDTSIDFHGYLERASIQSGIKFEEVYPVAYLLYLHVQQEMRGQGLGTRALREFETKYSALGCRLLMLSVGKTETDGDVERNKKWYSDCGWTVVEPTYFDLKLAFKLPTA
jgi:GNAT superfamily N-acetyltransferase